MMKDKQLKKMWIAMLCIFAMILIPMDAFAAEEVDMSAPTITTELPTLSRKGKTKITWSAPADYGEITGKRQTYELQYSTSKKFKKSKTTSVFVKKTYCKLDRSVFGENGGTYYFRVRIWLNRNKKNASHSDWSEVKTFNFVALNKANFSGLYHLLKDGGMTYAVNEDGDYVKERIIYDKNADGWFDPAELWEVYQLCTITLTRMENGVYKAYPSSKVSNMKGVKYFPNLYAVHLAQYSGSAMNLSKNTHLFSVDLKGVTASAFALNAPSAASISVEPPYESRLELIDLSACNSARMIYAYGSTANPAQTVKLPKNKKSLRSLSLSAVDGSTINLNAYTNLGEVYIYNMNLTAVKVDQCKKLKYFYIYDSDKITSLNLSANKKLIGVGVSYCSALKSSNIIVPKTATLKIDAGKWWYGTKEYEEFYDTIFE